MAKTLIVDKYCMKTFRSAIKNHQFSLDSNDVKSSDEIVSISLFEMCLFVFLGIRGM